MTLLEGAISLAQTQGYCVIPVARSKIPLVRNWPSLATTDLDTIEAWWSVWPNANVGIATGAKSGFWALDVDPKNGGLESLDAIRDKLDVNSSTPIVRTGGGGLHFYFRYDPARPVGNTASRLGPGLDTRGDGGYVVAPPSIHASGNAYEWVN